MNGTGPRFVKLGRAVRYALSAVREYIKSRQRNSTSEE
jgi:predicted DNA-binding transcriptional regulator AlpA